MNSAACSLRKGLPLSGGYGEFSLRCFFCWQAPLLPRTLRGAGVERFSEDRDAGAGQSVRVEHKFGEVRLHGEPGREGSKFSATIRGRPARMRKAEAFAQKVQIEVLQSGESVRIRHLS